MKTKALFLILLSVLAISGCSKKKTAVIPADHNEEALLANETFFDHPEEIILYNPSQENADKIKDCAFKVKAENSCPISDSPLLGMNKNQISINEIMNRTMSSKYSYFETFRNVLYQMPKETLNLFGSVNAIVISDRINPDFYHYSSGAIYLSGNNFWKTEAEREAANNNKDYRESFGAALPFISTREHYKRGRSLDLAERLKTRTDQQLAPLLIKLLFHELAHANDFFPKSFYDSTDMDVTKSYYAMTEENWEKEKVISQKMKTDLTSVAWKKASPILYQGEKADAEAKNTSAYTMLREFITDVAVAPYSYSSPREDMAMLIEESLFYHYYEYDSYVIIIKLPGADFKIPEDFSYPIAGGIKNKIAAPNVKERAEDILERVFNPAFADKISRSLETIYPVAIPEDTDWDNIKKI